MNNPYIFPSSNIIPCYRNNHFSTGLMKMYNKTLPIYSQKKYIDQIIYVHEPIISVQAQQKTREPILSTINCKSKYTVRFEICSKENS